MTGGLKKAFILFFMPVLLSASATAAAVPVSITAEDNIKNTVAVYGKIMRLGSQDAIEGAAVKIPDATLAGAGDADGFYNISLGPGNHTLQFSAHGYASKTKTVVAEPGHDIKLDVYLEKIDFTSDVIIVKGKKGESQAISSTLTQEELKKVPGTAGDAVRAVHDLPGVAAPFGDYSGELVVQGGGPQDNLYLLDNIPWPQPFHFAGLASTVDTDLIQSVDLNEAGFDSKWGGVMGSVLDVKTRPGKKDGIHADADLNLITSQFMVEGPAGLGNASFTFAGRRSYIDLLLNNLFKRNGFFAAPFFWDLGASLDFSPDKDNCFRAFGLGYEDTVGITLNGNEVSSSTLTGQYLSDSSAFTSGVTWKNNSLPYLASVLTPYYYRTWVNTGIGTNYGYSIAVNHYGIKEEAELNAGEIMGVKNTMGFGGDFEILNIDADASLFRNLQNGVPSGLINVIIDSVSSNRGAYLQDKIELNQALAITAGCRYDRYGNITDDTLLPRVKLEWNYDGQTLLDAVWGYYSQFPNEVQTNAQVGNPGLKPETAEHMVLGIKKDFSVELSARIDAYYKIYTNMIYSVNTYGVINGEGPGMAKGIEVFLQERIGERFFGWVSYALSKSERLDPATGKWVLYQYDQPNILDVVASYSITPVWSTGIKIRYNSGPLVQSLNGLYQDPSGAWYPQFSNTSTGNQRLEDYLQIDLRTDYAFLFEGWKLNVYFEILNLLDRANPAGLVYPTNNNGAPEQIRNLPLMGYFGLEAEF